jgi:hypothetical protein
VYKGYCKLKNSTHAVDVIQNDVSVKSMSGGERSQAIEIFNAVYRSSVKWQTVI